jgi:transposase
MRKYSKEFKLKVIQAYLSGGVGQRQVATSFNVGRTQLRDWLSVYQAQGAAALAAKRQHQRYSTEFKLSVLAHRRKHDLSLSDTATLFNIPSFSTLYVWEQRYNQGGINAFVGRRGRPKKMKNTTDSDQPITPNEPLRQQTHATLLREIEYLKAENAYLKKLDALIREKRLQQRTKPTSSQD